MQELAGLVPEWTDGRCRLESLFRCGVGPGGRFCSSSFPTTGQLDQAVCHSVEVAGVREDEDLMRAGQLPHEGGGGLAPAVVEGNKRVVE